MQYIKHAKIRDKVRDIKHKIRDKARDAMHKIHKSKRQTKRCNVQDIRQRREIR